MIDPTTVWKNLPVEYKFKIKPSFFNEFFVALIDQNLIMYKNQLVSLDPGEATFVRDYAVMQAQLRFWEEMQSFIQSLAEENEHE